MIKSMKVENFEAHKDSHIEFHPGVNVIVGPSDSGKSALVRALYWALTNSITGDSFRSHWGGTTEVAIEFSDGVLRRIRDSKFNGYKIGDQDYKGFGRTVPEDVQKYINMNEINFQRQADPHFMLQWTSGRVGEFLNKITNLEIIGQATQRIKQTISDEEKEKDALDADIIDLESEIESYSDIDQMELDLLRIDRLSEIRKDDNEEALRLNNLLVDITKADERIQELTTTVDGGEELDSMLASARRIQARREQADDIRDIVDEITDIDEQIDDLQIQIDKDERAYKKEMPEVCPLCGK